MDYSKKKSFQKMPWFIKESTLILVFIILDQWLKIYVSRNYSLGEQHILINRILSLTYVQNTGAAWSMFEQYPQILTVISVLFVIVLIFYIIKYSKIIKSSRWFKISTILIFSGAVGNTIDRVFHGYVIDMVQLDFINFPIFNLADSYLTMGIICLLIKFGFMKENK